ncbi:hypothetical protein HZ326_8069 [Fusarium oxysporum f. sp. albedinis]|nr:hypothetical protein HZ326_8069 [Fusarium oxysporum f. sp. albedinis]
MAGNTVQHSRTLDRGPLGLISLLITTRLLPRHTCLSQGKYHSRCRTLIDLIYHHKRHCMPCVGCFVVLDVTICIQELLAAQLG